MELKELDREQLEQLVAYLMGRAGLEPDWTPHWLENDEQNA